MHSGTSPRASVSSVKDPRYTGENRCIPCTVLNVGIAAVFSTAVIATLIPSGPTLAIGAGVGTFAVALALIYFRGYLVPGTPTITRLYFPERLLGRFDTPSHHAGWEDADPRNLLLELGVVIDDPIADDLTLDPGFVSEWERATERHWADELALRTSLANLAGIDPDRLEFEDRTRSFAAWIDGARLATWPSRAAFVTDVAGSTILPDWDQAWDRRPLALRADILSVLRLFLDWCPACDGRVSLSQEVVESCCRNRDIVAATCRDCDARLFEMDVDPTLLATETDPFDDR